jgi:hypothetical protein
MKHKLFIASLVIGIFALTTGIYLLGYYVSWSNYSYKGGSGLFWGNMYELANKTEHNDEQIIRYDEKQIASLSAQIKTLQGTSIPQVTNVSQNNSYTALYNPKFSNCKAEALIEHNLGWSNQAITAYFQSNAPECLP